MKKLIAWFEDEPDRIWILVVLGLLLGLGLYALFWSVMLVW